MDKNEVIQSIKDFIQTSSGCTFAARLISLWEDAKFRADVFTGPNAKHQVSTFLDAPGDSEVGIMIFPDVQTPEQVADLILALPEPRWKRVKVSWGKHDPKSLLVGLKWVLPDTKYITWAMGMGNLADMPPMRKAPYTAIIVRLRGPGRGHKRLDNLELVTFGDVPTLIEDDEDESIRKANETATKDKKEELLKGHPLSVMPKKIGQVAFALPLEFEDRLFPKSDSQA